MNSTIKTAYKFFNQFAVGFYAETKSEGINSTHFSKALTAHYLYNILSRIEVSGDNFLLAGNQISVETITDIHDKLSELADEFPETSASRVPFPDRGDLRAAFYSWVDPILRDGIGCNVQVQGGFATFEPIAGFDVFNRSLSAFWSTSLTIHDGNNYKWPLNELTQAFINANGTAITTNRVFMGSYVSDEKEILPILVYEADRTADQKIEIVDFIADYTQYIDNNGKSIYDPIELVSSCSDTCSSGSSSGAGVGEGGASDGLVSMIEGDPRDYLAAKLGPEFSNDGSRFFIRIDDSTIQKNGSNQLFVNPTNIDHDLLMNFVQDEHRAPDGITITVNTSGELQATNNFLTGGAFNSTNGIVTLSRQGLSDVSFSIDGRFITNDDLSTTLSAYATQSWVNSRPISTFNNDSGYITVNNYVTNADSDFNTSSGDLTLARQGLTDVVISMDGRYILLSEKGVVNGVATLGGNGLVPASQLPAFIDEVQEYANVAAFPSPGTGNIIYVALDSNLQYRWSGSQYTLLSPSAVTSFIGRTGAIQAKMGDYTTEMVTESGGVQYFTEARARAAIGVSGDLSYNINTGIIDYTEPTNVSHFSNDAGYLTGGDVVDLTTNQTINGNKTFNGTVQLNNGFIIINGGQNGYILTSDAAGNATWQPNLGGHDAVTLTGENYITNPSGQVLNIGQVDLSTSNVMGILPVVRGGTGVNNFNINNIARTNVSNAFINSQSITTSAGFALQITNTGITGDGILIDTADNNANSGVLWTQNGVNLVNLRSTAANTVIAEFAGNIETTGSIEGDTIVKTGGTPSQFLKADGSVDSNTYLTGNQTITLTGDATGSGSTSITITVVDNSHNHTISNVTELQSALNGKQPIDADLTAIAGLSGTSGLLRKTAANAWSLDANNYLTSFTETDPTVPAHVKNIESGDINNWNQAYNNYIVSIVVTGSATKTITLTQRDGGIIQGTFTDLNTDTTYSNGSGLSLNGTVFSHADTSTQASVNNSNGVVIQDITLDDFGHITGIGSVDLDDRYLRSVNLTDDVTGILPVANGGTGVNNFDPNNIVRTNIPQQIINGSLMLDGTLTTGGSLSVTGTGTFSNALNINFGSAVGNPIINFQHDSISQNPSISANSITGNLQLTSHGVNKLQTTSTGISVTGRGSFTDKVTIEGGGTDRIELDHSGFVGTIQSFNDGAFGDTRINNQGGNVQIYGGGVSVLQTSSTGISVTGTGSFTSSVTASQFITTGSVVIDSPDIRSWTIDDVSGTLNIHSGDGFGAVNFNTDISVTGTGTFANALNINFGSAVGNPIINFQHDNISQNPSISANRTNGNLQFTSHGVNKLQTTSDGISVTGETTTQTLNISNIPTSATGLSTGDVWNDRGLLRQGSDGVKVFNPDVQSLTGITPTLDVTNGVNAIMTLTGDTTITLTNLVAGMSGNMGITQDGTGGRTLTISPTPKVINGGAGGIQLTGTANSVDVISWWYDGTNLNVTYGLNYN